MILVEILFEEDGIILNLSSYCSSKYKTISKKTKQQILGRDVFKTISKIFYNYAPDGLLI